MIDWYKITDAAHERTLKSDCRLDSLQHDWERELAALWRMEADINNGGYLQFIQTWGRESYEYGSLALERIGARRMRHIVDQCQAIVDEHVDAAHQSDGNLRSRLPAAAAKRILELSYNFMDYPEDIAQLGLKYYAHHFLDANVKNCRGAR